MIEDDKGKLSKEFLKEMDKSLREKGIKGGYDYNAPKNDPYFRDIVTPAILKAMELVINEHTIPKGEKPAMSADQLEKILTTIVYTIFKNYTRALPERYADKMLANLVASHCTKLLGLVSNI